MESKVREVLGVAKKKDGSEIRGVKNNKSWVLMSCVLENDININLFAPVEVGDEVIELVQDPEYHSWKGKVKKASKSMVNMSDASTVLLTQILAELKSINENLTGRPAQSKFDEFVEKKAGLKRESDTVLEDIDDGPDDETQANKAFLESIPF